MSSRHYDIVEGLPPRVDASQVQNLLSRCYVEEGHTDSEIAREHFTYEKVKQRGDLYCAVSNTGELGGMIIFAPPTGPARKIAAPDEAEMHLIAVAPEARGTGLASSLVERFESRARELGFKKLVLWTQPTMIAARRLYERHGYHRDPERDFSGTRDFLVYVKEF